MQRDRYRLTKVVEYRVLVGVTVLEMKDVAAAIPAQLLQALRRTFSPYEAAQACTASVWRLRMDGAGVAHVKEVTKLQFR